MRAADAFQSDLRSRTGHKYVVTYEFDYTDAFTGEQRTGVLREGLSRVERVNNVYQSIFNAFEDIMQRPEGASDINATDIDFNSLRIISYVQYRR